MKEKKKPIYKRWWLWVIAVVFVFGIIGSFGDSDDKEGADNNDKSDVVAKDDSNKVYENSHNNDSNNDEGEQTLTNDEVKEIKQKVKENLKSEANSGDQEYEFHLDKFEYDENRNSINLRIAIQEDPLPSKNEIKEFSKDIAWYAAEATINEDFQTHVQSVAKFNEDEYILFGYADYKNGKVSFEGKEGLDLLD